MVVGVADKVLFRPGLDFSEWKTRILNIVVGCIFAIAISWVVLPWYASDEHLELLADGYSGAADVVADAYDALFSHFQAAAEVQNQDYSRIQLQNKL